MASYLGEFRNILIDIPGISDREKMARFTEGLKPHILLEVRKGSPKLFEEAAKITLDVDGACYGAGFFSRKGQNYGFRGDTGPVPMEKGNFEPRGKIPGIKAEILNDLKNNLCFVCHKPICRAFNHKDGKKQKNQVQFNNGENGGVDGPKQFQKEN